LLHYVAAGLTIASDVAFPGLVEARPVEVPDIRVFATGVPDFLPGGERRGPLMWTAPGRILIEIPDVVRLLMIDGRELRYRPAADNSPTDVAIFLNATGLGALFHQREMTVLHASAVLVGDRAVLFCGKSGAGKSTLAAALNQRGYPLVADDICAISKGTDGRPEATPDGRCLKLWQDAIHTLSLGTGEQIDRIRSEIDKFYVRPAMLADQNVPIAAIYRLREDRLTTKPVIDRMNLAEAAHIVVENAYRPRLVTLLNQRKQYLETAVGANQAGGVFALRRPIRFDLLDETVAQLEVHWRSLGLAVGVA
jgi:hypothetical protein